MDLNKNGGLPRWLAFRAQAVLAWEAASWPLLIATLGLGLLLLLIFTGALHTFGDPFRALSVVAALGALLFGLVRWAIAFASIRETDRAARIAADSGTTLSRLRLFTTRLSNETASSRALFEAYQQRTRPLIPRLRLKPPHARMARLDPMALRFAVFGAVIVAAFLAGGERADRFASAFQPHWITPLRDAQSVRLWQLPPDYLQRPAFEIPWAEGEDIILAEGTTLRVQVGDPRDLSRIRIAGRTLEADPENPLIGTAIVRTSGVAAFGAQRFAYEVVPDLPPNTDFLTSPVAGDDRRIRFEYFASDDHGADAVTLEARAADTGRDHPLSELIAVRLGRDHRAAVDLDLTDHPLAGRRVELRLKAVDGLGQSTLSPPVILTLPDALLVDPLARAIAYERKRLTMADTPFLQGRSGVLNADVDRVRDSLGLMREAPDLFESDETIHLALAFTDRGLALSRNWDEVDAYQPVLWDAALRAEGGELASAERALREAERQLNRALAIGESASEIMRLTMRYEEAVARYMELLMAEAVAEGRISEAPQGGAGSDVSEDQLEELMRTLQELVETGNFEEARRLLAFITDLLRDMQVELTTGGSGEDGEPSPFEEALDELDELIAEQRRLQSETIRNRQNGGSPQTATEQSELAERTGNLDSGGDEGDENASAGQRALEEAARAMTDAARELGRDNGFGAAMAQGDALEALREAATALSEADQAAREGSERANDSISRDPLGRNMTGGRTSDREDVTIPDGSRRGEARAVLDALRDALSDQTLTDQERAYLRALLDQF